MPGAAEANRPGHVYKGQKSLGPRKRGRRPPNEITNSDSNGTGGSAKGNGYPMHQGGDAG